MFEAGGASWGWPLGGIATEAVMDPCAQGIAKEEDIPVEPGKDNQPDAAQHATTVSHNVFPNGIRVP